LRFNIGGNISDVVWTKLPAKRRHAVFAIGHLVSDGLFMAFVVVSQVSLEIVLLESALTVNNVASTHMTCSAVGRENLLAMRCVNSGNHGRGEQSDQSRQRYRKKVTHA